MGSDGFEMSLESGKTTKWKRELTYFGFIEMSELGPMGMVKRGGVDVCFTEETSPVNRRL